MSRSCARRPLRSIALGALRAGAYLTVVLGVATAFGVRAAKAEAGKAGMTLGRTLLPLIELETEATALRINGQDLFVSSALVERDITGVLDAFESQCETDANPLAEAWPRAPKEPTETAKARGKLPRLDVFRKASAEEGVVFCFARGGGRSFAEAVASFAKDQDLGAFGELRYAYARADAETGQTRVLATWTTGRFRVNALEENGDTSGRDPEMAPRPKASTRVLSATLVGSPYGMYAYTTDSPALEVIASYDSRLREAGWVTIRVPGEASGRAYERDGAQIFVAAAPEVSAGRSRTLVSIGELGIAGAKASK